MNNIENHILDFNDISEIKDWEKKIEMMYDQQIQTWNMARNHYNQFKSIETRDITLGNYKVTLQHNPARVRSTCADLSKKVIENRKCFLCADNLPSEQKGFKILDKYLMLVNPFPIFDRHLTISDFNHTPQRIENRVIDMLELAYQLPTFYMIYNGPMSGASAPDHFHFQAIKKGIIPYESEIENLEENKKKILIHKEDIKIYTVPDFERNCIILESGWKEPIDFFFENIIEILPFNFDAGEPMLNLIAGYENEKFRLTIFPRGAQRPSCYLREDEKRIIISPASVEMAGIIVTPREEDFNNVTADDINEIFKEVSIDDSLFKEVIEEIKKIL